MNDMTVSGPVARQAFSEALRAMSLSYARALPEKIGELEDAIVAFVKPTSGEDVQLPHRLAHSLNGSARTFGYPEVSALAREMELLLEPHTKSSTTPSGEELERLRELLENLKHTAHRINSGLPSSTEAQAPEKRTPKAVSHSVYLLEGDASEANRIKDQLSGYGYDVHTFSAVSALQDATRACPPRVIVASIGDEEDAHTIAQKVRDLAKQGERETSIVFLSEQDSVWARLQAVRAGGAAYCVKPLRMLTLVDCLDALVERDGVEPSRVLIVEDEPIHAEYCARILETAGVSSHIVTLAAKTLDAMREFNPDLVLMDMYLPGCTGDELAKVIRQTESFMSIPIVFLSVENNFDRQLRAMDHGGDEFLTKPITPSQLLSVVRSRVRRYREIKKLMMHDSLTGLANHAHLQQQLKLEISKTARSGKPLSFVMIDIDHFKQANDRFGHPVGDRVIKTLARFLRQRLRGSDVVGRYGGEEFAIIMSNTESEDAFQLVQKLRDSFSRIPIETGTETFQVTFSAGIASISKQADARNLLQAADAALYREKSLGRNRVEKYSDDLDCPEPITLPADGQPGQAALTNH